MRRVVVVGATGHIGSYLVPRLVRGGYEVIAVSRGIRGPYLQSPQWDSVTTVTVDRAAADAEGSFGAQVAALRPDVVIDLICFTAASAQRLVDALRPAVPPGHVTEHGGTGRGSPAYACGPTVTVPTVSVTVAAMTAPTRPASSSSCRRCGAVSSRSGSTVRASLRPERRWCHTPPTTPSTSSTGEFPAGPAGVSARAAAAPGYSRSRAGPRRGRRRSRAAGGSPGAGGAG